MPKVFRSWDVDQGWLLPPAPHEFVSPGHMAYFVRETVREALDLSAILDAYSQERGTTGAALPGAWASTAARNLAAISPSSSRSRFLRKLE